MQYQEEEIPEAKFMYDISPMAVTVTKEGRRWYDYLTSLLSLLGGAFAVIRLLDDVIYNVMKPKKD